MPDTPMGSAAWPLFSHGRRWFRIKGYGIRYVNHRRHPMFFSERNGYRRGLHVGPHCLMVVKPRPRPGWSNPGETATVSGVRA